VKEVTGNEKEKAEDYINETKDKLNK